MKAKSIFATLKRAFALILLFSAILASVTFDAPQAWSGTVTYTYDELGRLKAITYSNGTTTAYSLDAAGNRTNVVSLLDTTPPTVPTGLTAIVISQSQINLAWNASTDSGSGMGGYYVLRNGSNVATVNASSTSFSDTGLAGYTTYTYTVEAFDLASPPNVSAPSTSASGTTPDQTAPTIPTLSATAASQTQINLSWTASTDSGGSGLGGYKIFRNGGTSPIATPGPTTTTYSDTGLSGYTAYSYTIEAFDNANNVSAQSNTASATTPDQTPPSAVTLSGAAISSSQVNLSWSTSTDTGGSGLNYYQIKRNGSVLTNVSAPTTSYSDTSVGGGTTYNYTAVAYDHAGNASTVSNTASVTTPSGAPTVPGQPTPNGVIVTASPFTVSWGASTGSLSYYTVSSNNGSTTTKTNVTAPTTSLSIAAGNGLTYTITVVACNSSNVCSASSPSATITYCKGGTCP